MLIYRSEVCADLEGPEVRDDREDVDQLEGGEDVGGGKQTLTVESEWRLTRAHLSLLWCFLMFALLSANFLFVSKQLSEM